MRTVFHWLNITSLEVNFYFDVQNHRMTIIYMMIVLQLSVELSAGVKCFDSDQKWITETLNKSPTAICCLEEHLVGSLKLCSHLGRLLLSLRCEEGKHRQRLMILI